MKKVVIFTIISFLAFNIKAYGSSSHPSQITLYSQNGTQIQLDYDVVDMLSNRPFVIAEKFQFTILNKNIEINDRVEVTFYEDRISELGSKDVRKKKEKVILNCNREGYCQGFLSQNIGLIKYSYDFKHWLTISINGTYLIDPIRNNRTFRAILNLY